MNVSLYIVSSRYEGVDISEMTAGHAAIELNENWGEFGRRIFDTVERLVDIDTGSSNDIHINVQA